MPPRIAPASRMWRTSARVSTPAIAGMPQSSSQSSQPRSAVAQSSPFLASRMITPRAWTASDSIAVGADAVVADQRVGEGDDLPGVARVGDRLLVAGHAGVEDDLAERLGVGGAAELAVEARAVLEQDVAARRAHGAQLQDEPLDGLEAVGARLAEQLEQRRLDAGQPGAGALRLGEAELAVRLACGSRPRRRRRGPRRRWSSSSSTVWLTQTWASIPQTIACSRPPRSNPSAEAAEKTVFAQRLDAGGQRGRRPRRRSRRGPSGTAR